ncbi:TetR/AcrR family transcriptional regulator [Amycolatopsis pithecellobii]|uniref:TetR family transcriptional regulator n=1 Tax=Amycolatopsis pithecellobii TaxID=664692 RepID=A0A6N7Z037_9PSEU|nr:TetR family transcriptional regulator [Amycolatopsis pithecellobii]MTD54029.1 TetR family transcriptional regulator [Amycolatopsis pithecellobii]
MKTQPEVSAPRTRRGRRPGQNTTRQAVLDAARRRFAADGFKATTIRAIAEDADVDAALVMQFFRSKDELFGAVMSISPDALSRIANAFGGPVESIGERLVREYLAVWEGDQSDADALRAMLRGAIANEKAKSLLRDFIEARLSENLRQTASDSHDAAVRVALAASMLIGVTVGRQLVQVAVLADEEAEAIVRHVGPALQAILAPTPATGHEDRS